MRKLFCKLHGKRKRGYTLLEMLVVVVILGVLTAIAIPTYNRAVKRSRIADGLNMLDVLASAQNKYFVEHGHYTDSLADLNAPVKKSSINQDGAIITTNFTYSKGAKQSCIFAEGKENGGYTIAKNYKTNAKPRCAGNGCSEISSFVESGDISAICPEGSDQCNKTEEFCIQHGYTGVDLDKCICTGYQCDKNLDWCISHGYSGFDSLNCACTKAATPECYGNATQWVELGTSCTTVDEGYTAGGCGHKSILQRCENGKWTNTDTYKCENNWLINQCGGSSNVNWEDVRPACTCKAAQCSAGAIQFEQTEESCTSSYFADGSNGSDGKILSNGGSSGSGDRGSVNSNSSIGYSAEIKCGVKRKELKCSKDGRWQYTGNYECHQKVCGGIGSTLYLNLETCNCERTCPLPKPTANQLNCPVSTHPVELCDPCPSSPSNPYIIENIVNQSQTNSSTGLDPKGSSPSSSSYSASTECFHCGYRTASYEVACNDGSWQCVNNNTCHNVSGNIPAYSGECDGGMNNSNRCGAYRLTNVNCRLNDSFSGVDLFGSYSNVCQPKPGNACFTGQIRTCDTTSSSTASNTNNSSGNSPKGGSGNNLVQICQDDCQWSECMPDPNADCGSLDPLPALELNACQVKGQECKKQSDGSYAWQYTNTPVLKPGAQCVNGETETCYIGGGNGGSPKGQVVPGVPNDPGSNTGGGNNNGGSGVLGRKVCENCQWSECHEICTGPQPSSYSGPCKITIQGKEYCGTTNMVYSCVNGKWEAHSDGTCTNEVIKPEGTPTEDTGCFYRVGEYVCSFPSFWGATYGDWLPKQPGNVCNNGEHHQIGNNNYKFCKECKWYKCPEGSNVVYNSHTNACYSANDIYVSLYTVEKNALQCQVGDNPQLEYCPSYGHVPQGCPVTGFSCLGGNATSDFARGNWNWVNTYCQQETPTKIGIPNNAFPTNMSSLVYDKAICDVPSSNPNMTQIPEYHRYCPVKEQWVKGYRCTAVTPIVY